MRTDGHVITKMSRLDRLPNFLEYRAPRVVLRFYITITVIYNTRNTCIAEPREARGGGHKGWDDRREMK